MSYHTGSLCISQDLEKFVLNVNHIQKYLSPSVFIGH